MPREKRPEIQFILSVDTEEEFDWGEGFPQQNCSIENIKQIPAFQAFCDQLGVRPTYLIDYPVAQDLQAAAVFRGFVQQGKAEVGAHLHPWCNPPLTEENGEYESHIIHLPGDLIRSKLKVLTDAIYTNIGIAPTCFRTGRWGTDAKVIQALLDAQFLVDSSVIPLYENQYFSFLDSPNQPYWPDLDDPLAEGAQRELLEIPVSSGFTRSNYIFWRKLHKTFSGKRLRHLHLIGLLCRLKLVKKVYLSPELANTSDMKALVGAEIRNKNTVIHMFFHSSSLITSTNGYSQNDSDVVRLHQRIREVVLYLRENANVTFCTISECMKGANKYVDG